LFEFILVCHGVLFLMILPSSVEFRENCETSENHQLNVARHAFSCSMRFGFI
jgi:hypothetical protein